MKILMTGATGFIGQALCKHWHTHQLTILTRNSSQARALLGEQHTFIGSLDSLSNLDGFDAVVNLAGEAIADKPWTSKQRHKIEHSRWHLTQEIVKLIDVSNTPPHTFLSGSAIGIYDYGDQAQNEGSRFTMKHYPQKVCYKWEQIALDAHCENTRVCCLRTAVVLGSQGGLLKRLLPIFKLGAGGAMGSGKQLMSWIHLNDEIKAIDFLLNHQELAGAFNLSAPEVVSNEQLTRKLGQQLKRPTLLKVPAFALKLALGEMSQMILASQNIAPQRLLESGFEFDYPSFDIALENATEH